MPTRRFVTGIIAAGLLAATVFAMGPAEAQSRCQAVTRTGQVDVIFNAFPVMDHISRAIQACANANLRVNVKVTDRARQEIEEAFAAAVSPFEMAQVSNGVFVNLLAKGQLQPITDLVNKYKAQYKLEDRMLVTVGNEVYGIAFMANAQHLFYRKDALEKAGVAVPKTYDELLAALPKLRAAGFEHPFAAAYRTGWDVATEFTNIYLGAGGQFFQPGTARPAFNNPTAVQALELMAKLKAFMSPNAQALATGDVTTAFQQGQAAIGMLWASRAAAMDDAAVSRVKDMVEFAAAPAVRAGGKPASAIWWDALVMPKAMDGDREAAFQLMMEALSEDTMKSGMNLTNWLRSTFVPNRHAAGVAATLAGNAELWPDQPFFSLAHTALGKAAADVLAGTKTPQAALADAEREYTQTARERGFLQ